MSLEQFFHMGGYAFYVWTSYGLALTVLILNLVLPLVRQGAVRRQLARKPKQSARNPR
ncbi:heme exporter protein CcmD [Methylococcus sp. EFPC2]|uniref:heme exporter protein CcmD n=1 Tax=Methylococcus sp. EFPC2 TaxID=2812648 RepID=UPI0019680BB7|nr:heme exporter protein CcmD [Methylococcus sp. EFPC2]QSA96067.1 heme exporter protein CcmD [Methylococcus sp. EFPC2]